MVRLVAVESAWSILVVLCQSMFWDDLTLADFTAKSASSFAERNFCFPIAVGKWSSCS